jgi:hypothetical protein
MFMTPPRMACFNELVCEDKEIVMSPFSDVVVLGTVSELTMGGHNTGTDGITDPDALSTKR